MVECTCFCHRTYDYCDGKCCEREREREQREYDSEQQFMKKHYGMNRFEWAGIQILRSKGWNVTKKKTKTQKGETLG